MKLGIIIGSLLLVLGCAQDEAIMNGVHSSKTSESDLLEQGSDAVVRVPGSTDNEAVISPEVSVPVQETSVDEAIVNESLALTCLTDNQIVGSQETMMLQWQITEEDTGFMISVEGGLMLGSYQMGSSPGSIMYQAPEMIAEEQKIKFIGTTDDGQEASCLVTLKADQDIGVADDGKVDGLVGQVFELAAQTQSLPDFGLYTEKARIVVNNLDVPERAFDTGFPGLPELFEWFGIQFLGEIEIPESGQYWFRLTADDGSNLYIGDEKVIDNDGVHATKSVDGSIYLEKGSHPIRVDYFQGPRYHITLQLLWKDSMDGDFSIVPSASLSRQK
ncbi:PA14 domain-containing protein [Pseudobacteriovorax antillogorgiicola]|nr:PA14 domain-containing protein [Pseudobacteriovorax antillogorgiicola]